MSSTSPAANLGTPLQWAVDFGLIGAASGALAPYLVAGDMLGDEYVLTTGLAGAVVGAILGAVLPFILERVVSRVPFGLLLFMGPLIGAIWGGATGFVGGLTFPLEPHTGIGSMLIVSVMCAGIAGALQFSWLWLPYTLLRAKGKRTWPVVALAFITPVLGLLGLTALISV